MNSLVFEAPLMAALSEALGRLLQSAPDALALGLPAASLARLAHAAAAANATAAGAGEGASDAAAAAAAAAPSRVFALRFEGDPSASQVRRTAQPSSPTAAGMLTPAATRTPTPTAAACSSKAPETAAPL